MSLQRPLPPFIADQLNHLLSHSPLQIKVGQIWWGNMDSCYADRFSLLIPFCLDYMKWDFICDATNPLVAPDIVCPVGDEDFNPLLEIVGGGKNGEERSSCLRDWNSKDPTRLLALVHEIRGLYLEYHKKRLVDLGDERLKFEASTILTREGIEVCVITGPDRAEEVKFAVPLLDTIDLNKLVPGCLWKRQQKIYLEAVFPVSRGYSSAPPPRTRLVPSQPDLKSLFAVEDVKLPPWVNGMCMAEYLPMLEDNLQVQVMEAVAAIGGRRRFIEALAPLFGRPVEADSVFCRKATVFAVSGAFSFLVHFTIPTQFPRTQPVLTMQSCQHTNSHGLAIVSAPVIGYPWSPRWSQPEMSERIFEFLLEESLNFKKHCSDLALQ